MADEVKLCGFTARLTQFFGKKPGQTLGEFAKEIKGLTYEDKLEFWEAFNAQGMPTEKPMPSAAA